MPTFVRTMRGWRCYCENFWGEGASRAIAFAEWKQAVKTRRNREDQ